MNNETTNTETTTTTTGFCDICGAQETAAADTLRCEGWFIGSREHFCPGCND
jgi:hypothetical protein